MVAMKIDIEIPECCDECIYYSCRPHPYKGWSDMCELGMHTMNDDDGDWHYGGDGRPKLCPLIQMTDCDAQVRAEAIEELLKSICIGCAYLNGTKCEYKSECPCRISQAIVIREANKVLNS